MNVFVVVLGKMYFLCKKAEVSFLDPKQISFHIMLREHQHQNTNAF